MLRLRVHPKHGKALFLEYHSKMNGLSPQKPYPSLLRLWLGVAGVSWVVCVTITYLFFNRDYYVEKISIFGRFLFG